jgi:hypothetical protein
MSWLWPTEREKWASPFALSRTQPHLGLPALDARSRDLYERALPRGVLAPRFAPDRPPLNYWMPPYQLAQYAYLPGQIILGKFANRLIGYLDDRPQITIAGARAGKTSTVLEPNLHLYPGSMLVLDPKAELAKTARLRRALGHDVFVLDPFGHSGEPSACFNALAELDPDSWTIVDDVASITQALIVDEGDTRSQHWNNSAQALLKGIILLTLTFPEGERNLVTVRELLSLTNARLLSAVAFVGRHQARTERTVTGRIVEADREEFPPRRCASTRPEFEGTERKAPPGCPGGVSPDQSALALRLRDQIKVEVSPSSSSKRLA